MKNKGSHAATSESINEKKTATTVSVVSIIINLLLSAFKFVAGIIGNSSAMISDAVHSASDVLSTFAVIIGFKYSTKEADKQHQYGHERMESIAALIVAFLLCITGIGIGFDGIKKVFFNDGEPLQIPTLLPLIAAIVSIVLKELMYWMTIIPAKKLDSPSLKADAWHHRSDAFSSIGSFVGILGARMGFPILDPVFSVIISLLIIKTGVDIVKDTVDRLVDKALDEKTANKMKMLVLNEEGVISLDVFKTRLFGAKVYVDIEISADKSLTLEDSHDIAKRIHDKIEEQFPKVKHCMIHVNPYYED